MKVSQIDRDYKLARKVNLFWTSLFKDYNHRAYIGSLKLCEAGVDTLQPIACWTCQLAQVCCRSCQRK